MDGVKEEAIKLLSDFRGAIAKLGDAKKRLAKSTTTLDATARLIAAMPAGAERTFAQTRIAKMKQEVNTHRDRVGFVDKSASATWEGLKKVLGGLGITIPPVALRGGGGVGVAIVLPVLAVAALLIAAKKLYDAVVNDTRRIDNDAAKLRLLAEGKISPKQLADALEPAKPGGIFGDVGKAMVALAAVMLIPAVLPLIKRPSA